MRLRAVEGEVVLGQVTNLYGTIASMARARVITTGKAVINTEIYRFDSY